MDCISDWISDRMFDWMLEWMSDRITLDTWEYHFLMSLDLSKNIALEGFKDILGRVTTNDERTTTRQT